MTGSSITCTFTHFPPTNKRSDFFLILKRYKIPKASIHLSVLNSKIFLLYRAIEHSTDLKENIDVIPFSSFIHSKSK